MYIPKKKPGRTTEKWKKEAEDGFKRFIDEADSNMRNDIFSNECSPGDSEACYLSQFIFQKIFKVFGKNTEIYYKKYFRVEGYDFYFDLMNNPKYECKKNNKQKRPGKKIEKSFKEKYVEWKNIKYTLGNFTPYPDIDMDGKRFQQYHEAICYERWDLTLLKLQEVWDNKIPMTFNEYLICTGQIIYDREVFINIPLDSSKNIAENRITIEWYKEQAKYIKENPVHLINFNGDSDNDNKELENEHVEFAIDTILKLIRVRTIILLLLLREPI